MTRFYIDIDDGGGNLITDQHGIDAESLEAVRIEATSMLADASGEMPSGLNQKTMTAYVRNGAGHLILKVTLAVNVEWARLV